MIALSMESPHGILGSSAAYTPVNSSHLKLQPIPQALQPTACVHGAKVTYCTACGILYIRYI